MRDHVHNVTYVVRIPEPTGGPWKLMSSYSHARDSRHDGISKMKKEQRDSETIRAFLNASRAYVRAI